MIDYFFIKSLSCDKNVKNELLKVHFSDIIAAQSNLSKVQMSLAVYCQLVKPFQLFDCQQNLEGANLIHKVYCLLLMYKSFFEKHKSRVVKEPNM